MQEKESKEKEKYLTIRQVADLLRISTRTIYRWRKEGRIKTVRVNQTVRVTQGELDRLSMFEEVEDGEEEVHEVHEMHEREYRR